MLVAVYLPPRRSLDLLGHLLSTRHVERAAGVDDVYALAAHGRHGRRLEAELGLAGAAGRDQLGHLALEQAAAEQPIDVGADGQEGQASGATPQRRAAAARRLHAGAEARLELLEEGAREDAADRPTSSRREQNVLGWERRRRARDGKRKRVS